MSTAQYELNWLIALVTEWDKAIEDAAAECKKQVDTVEEVYYLGVMLGMETCREAVVRLVATTMRAQSRSGSYEDSAG